MPASTSYAQSSLPDISCTVENGAVSVSWNSQYAGLKSISVLRSADSVYDFNAIGIVNKPVKGAQAYLDASPLEGRNFYKLSILFSSGVTWASNICKCITPSRPTNAVSAPKPKDTLGVSRQNTDLGVPGRNANGGALDTISSRLPKKKIVVAFDDPTEQPSTFIKSKYLSTDPASGHLIMNLPDDVATHHYSIRFYDGVEQLVTEVPHINNAHIIFDKRNFPRKGLYKFVLRRDVVELESGYISVR